VAIRVIMVVLMLATSIALGLIAYELSIRIGDAGSLAAKTAPAVQYLVAARPLSAGTLARIEDFTPRTAVADTVPAGAIIDTQDARADLRISLIRRYLEPGAVITRADVLRPHDRGFLAAVLAPDTRAVSIAVNAVSGVAGLISPGDHVDVILTQEIQHSPSRTEHLVTSETVLANVLVIAVDQAIAQGAPMNGAAATRPASTVTIQTTTDQAERVTVATRIGALSLAVRSSDGERSSDQARGNPVSSAEVSQALAKATISDGYHVEVIQGGERSEVMFK
jgi:pilus assembly protein CpaB